LLLPQPNRKSRQVETPPRLETPEQVRRSEERDQALARRAQREREEIAVDRARFELTRDKIVFGLEMVVATLVVVAGLVAALRDPGTLPLLLLGGGGLGGVVAFFRRSRAATPTETG
jgi:hypothetical protein